MKTREWKYRFPPDQEFAGGGLESMKKALEADKLVIEAGGRLIVIPAAIACAMLLVVVLFNHVLRSGSAGAQTSQ